MSMEVEVGGGPSSRRRGAVRASWRLWLGLVALAPATVSVASFMTYFSISVQLTKALVYQPSLLATVYLNLPQISTVGGAASLGVGLIALLGSPKALEAAGLGLGVGVVFFFGSMFLFAQAAMVLSPPGPGSVVGAISAATVAFTPAPPAIGMIGPAGGTTLFLIRVRGFGERRPAIGAVIIGGMVATYWLFNWLMFSFGPG